MKRPRYFVMLINGTRNREPVPLLVDDVEIVRLFDSKEEAVRVVDQPNTLGYGVYPWPYAEDDEH